MAGLSLRTLELYLLLFCCRYLDLFWNFLSLYTYLLKVIYVVLSLGTVAACHCLP